MKPFGSYIAILLTTVAPTHGAHSAAHIAAQLGHSATVNSVIFSTDGKLIITASDDGAIIIWERSSGRQLRRISGHQGPVNAVAIAPDGIRLASGGEDGKACIWDIRTGARLDAFEHSRGVTSLTFSKDGTVLLTGGKDNTAHMWSVALTRERTNGIELKHFKTNNWISSVAFSPDERWVLTGTLSGAQLWNVSTGKLAFALGSTKLRVKSVNFTLDSKFAFVGTKELGFWDIRSGKLAFSLPQTPGVVDASAISRDGRLIAVSFTDFRNVSLSHSQLSVNGDVPRQTVIWEISSRREVERFSTTSSIKSAVFSPEGTSLLLGTYEGIAALWSLKTSSFEDHSFQRAVRTPSSVAYALSNSSEVLLLGTREGAVEKWNLKKGRLESTFGANLRSINSIAVSEAGVVLTGSDDHNACVFRVEATQCQFLLKHDGPVTSVAIDSTGELGITGSEDRTARTWDLRTGKATGQPFRTCERVTAVAIAPGNELIATGEGEIAYGLRFDADNRLVIAKCRTFPIHVWSLVDGHQVFEWLKNLDFVTSVSFSQDGKFVLSSSEDGTAEIWRISDKLTRFSLNGHSAAVTSAVFSKSGKFIVTTGKDKQAFLWDSENRVQLGPLAGHQDSVTSATFLSDDHFVATTSWDGTVALWNASNRKRIASLFSSTSGAWFVVDDVGHFDTNLLEGDLPLHWIMDDSPDHAEPIEIFMRDYYEPRLLEKLLSCTRAEVLNPEACESRFEKVRPLAELNRIQPEVEILGVRGGASADEALVEVAAVGKKDPAQPNGKIETSAYDLRLFRNGQLVGQWPVPEHGMAGPQDANAWRDVSAVPTPTHIFPVRLAAKDRGKPVTFTAYAFNEDRVKSETTPPVSYMVPQDVPARRGKAYVVTIGINGYENPHRNLEFAVKDAEDMASALQQIKDYKVVSVSLLSEAPKEGAAAPVNHGTRAKIRAVLRILAGSSGDAELGGVANADKLAKATPDDLVILSFSGHGYTERNGAFYLLPSDSGKEDAVTPDSLKKFISSEELSEWLRDVDAGQMAMIIDACHSAASVETPGFKPGPMGDRGLGQLAYDKGMRILAASQADDVALEVQNLHHGLLTYALVVDGLKPGEGGKLKADLNGDGQVTLEEWLKYGEQRTPTLYDDAKAGKVKLVSRDSTVNPAFLDETTRRAQTPTLFDFHKRDENVILREQ
jgi:WD40 repeat protein/uncharacterized caspase-like protein